MAKLPKGWKPGPTPEIKDHPSVVRHTDPVIRTSIGIGYLDGATHVRFQANPDCCDLCSKMDGTVRRINTVMNWKFLNVHPNCYSPDTEVYTDRGWISFFDFRIGDRAFSLNPETLIPEFIEPVGIVSADYNGDLIRLYNRNFDLCTTPDHNHFVNRHNKGWGFVRADSCTGSNDKFYRGCEWDSHGVSQVTVADKTLDTNDYFRLLAYHLSDGSFGFHKNGKREIRIVRDRVTKSEKYDKLRSFLSGLPWRWWFGKDGATCSDKGLFNHLLAFGRYSVDRFIPDIVRNADREQIQVFLDAYVECDGYERTREGGLGFVSTSRSYFSSSKIMADVIGELVMKAGGRPGFSIQRNKDKPVDHFNGVYVGNYDIHIVRHNRHVRAQCLKVERIPYDGLVYCLTLPKYHILYVRRNGKPVWSGNCLCHWVPMKKEGGEFVDLPVYVTKSEKMNLVQKEVTVRRGGKTFKQMRWVRPDKASSSGKKESPGGGSSEPKSDSDGGPDLLDIVLADLKKTEAELIGLKDGEEKTISGIPAINLGDGYYGLKVHGKRVAAIGAHSAALMLQGVTKLTASGAATMAGDLKGGSVAAPQAKAAKVASATKAKVQSSMAEKPKPRDDKNSKDSKGKAEKGKGEG